MRRRTTTLAPCHQFLRPHVSLSPFLGSHVSVHPMSRREKAAADGFVLLKGLAIPPVVNRIWINMQSAHKRGNGCLSLSHHSQICAAVNEERDQQHNERDCTPGTYRRLIASFAHAGDFSRAGGGAEGQFRESWWDSVQESERLHDGSQGVEAGRKRIPWAEAPRLAGRRRLKTCRVPAIQRARVALIPDRSSAKKSRQSSVTPFLGFWACWFRRGPVVYIYAHSIRPCGS